MVLRSEMLLSHFSARGVEGGTHSRAPGIIQQPGESGRPWAFLRGSPCRCGSRSSPGPEQSGESQQLPRINEMEAGPEEIHRGGGCHRAQGLRAILGDIEVDTNE